MKLSHIISAAALMIGASLAAPVAHASTFVIGSGAAHDCSVAAIAGRDTPDTLELCTLALDTELLDNNDEAKTYVNRAVIYLRLGYMRNSGLDLDAAEKLDAKLPEIYVNRGALLIRQARFQDAIGEIDRGLALGPTQPEKAYFNRGLAHEGIGDTRGAYFDYKKAADLNPNFAPAARELLRFHVEPVAAH